MRLHSDLEIVFTAHTQHLLPRLSSAGMCDELRLEWPALAAALSTGPPDAVASALRKASRAVDAAQSACAWPRQLQVRRRLLLGAARLHRTRSQSHSSEGPSHWSLPAQLAPPVTS